MRNLLIRALPRFVIHPHREASRKGVFEFILREMRNRTLMEILELETATEGTLKERRLSLMQIRGLAAHSHYYGTEAELRS